MSLAAPPSQPSRGFSAEAWALLLALSLPWGGAFLLFRVLGQELPTFTIVLGRCGLAVPALYLLLRLRGQRLDIPWGQFLVMGLLNNVIPFALFAWAEPRVTSGLAAILNAATPVMTVLVLAAFGVERLDNTFKTQQDIERTLGISFLGIIPSALLAASSSTLACEASVAARSRVAWPSRRA